MKQVEVRDPSMLTVVATDDGVSLEGKKNGVTGVTVIYATGEMERALVVVGNGINAKGARMEHTQVVDLKQTAAATAKAKPPPTKKEKERAAVRDANDVVRAAVEAL